MKHPDIGSDLTKHNYWPQLQKLIEEKLISGIHDVYILHDDWCALLVGHGQYCDCNPIVETLPWK